MSGRARARPVAGGHLFVPRRLHRRGVLIWLRRTHAWLGLWGAVLGLLFGLTGVLLNHRSQLKIPLAQTAESRLEVPVQGAPASPQALGEALARELGLDARRMRVRREPARAAAWGDGAIRQPERWQVSFAAPERSVTAEYWAGNRYASVRITDPNVYAWLTRLHKGTGVGIGWILLADTIGGGLAVLALTGLLLWTRLHGPRLLALGLVGTCAAAAVTFAA